MVNYSFILTTDSHCRGFQFHKIYCDRSVTSYSTFSLLQFPKNITSVYPQFLDHGNIFDSSTPHSRHFRPTWIFILQWCLMCPTCSSTFPYHRPQNDNLGSIQLYRVSWHIVSINLRTELLPKCLFQIIYLESYVLSTSNPFIFTLPSGAIGYARTGIHALQYQSHLADYFALGALQTNERIDFSRPPQQGETQEDCQIQCGVNNGTLTLSSAKDVPNNGSCYETVGDIFCFRISTFNLRQRFIEYRFC